MSYRNDFDAVVARVDALSSENAQLAAENAKLRAGAPIITPPPPVERAVARGTAAFVLAALAGVGVLAASVMTHGKHVTRHDSPPAARTNDPARLRACALTLELAPVDSNATVTDPHGEHHSIGAVQRSTGCRTEIRDVLDDAVISAKERAALVRWGDAEAKLDATVSMIGEYYAHDPYALDGYSTAPQLWTEYDRALVVRNFALAEWHEASR